MSAQIDVLNPAKPKRVLMVASNSSKSQTTGWDIGVEEEARKLPIRTNYINGGQFRAFAVRDGNLITGQQQYSGTEAARLVIAALGQ